MTKIAGSESEIESGSRSISKRHGSPDPDPHQNFMDPEHCFVANSLLGAAVFVLPIMVCPPGSCQLNNATHLWLWCIMCSKNKLCSAGKWIRKYFFRIRIRGSGSGKPLHNGSISYETFLWPLKKDRYR